MAKSLKKRMQEKKVTLGCWITLGHTAIPEILLKAGFDWLTIDMEHSAITLSEAQQLIQVIELGGATPLVRVGVNDPLLIKQVMDAGAHGVIVPMVNSVEEAQAAVSAVKYPPIGTRGVGLGRAQGYGSDFEAYKNWAEKESIVVVQIEHIKGAQNLENILSVKGVDGFLVGPYDLSASMGMPGQFDHPEVLQVLNKIKEIASKSKVVSGFHVISPTPEAVTAKIKEGFRFVAFSLDSLLLSDFCRRGVASIKANIKE